MNPESQSRENLPEPEMGAPLAEQKRPVTSADSEADAIIKILEREKRHPEKNLVDKIGGALWFLGVVTRENNPTIESEMPERPLSVRRERAELYKRVREAKKDNNRDEMRRIFQEAHERDEILKQFLTQGEIKIADSDIGENESRFAVVNPPAEREDKSKPPIVIIPGISNDLACVDSMAQELAFSGRRVVVLSYPESFMGKVSPEFASECEKSQTYSGHVKFFSKAIEKLLPNSEMELWGYSTGGPIMAELIKNRPDLAAKITDAVLVSPSGSVEQNKRQLFTGLAKEVKSMVSKGLASLVLTAGRKISEGAGSEPKEQRPLKERVFNSLLKKIQKPSINFEDIKIKEGGSVVVVSYDKDDVTQSRKLAISEDSQTKSVVLPGRHVTPLMEPKMLIEQVVALQQKN